MDRGRIALGLIDLFFALAFFFVFIVAMRWGSTEINGAGVGFGALFLLSAAAMLTPIGSWALIGKLVSWLQIAGTAVLGYLILATYFYVHGSFGSMGEIASASFLAVLALVIEICALYPIARLVYLCYRTRPPAVASPGAVPQT